MGGCTPQRTRHRQRLVALSTCLLLCSVACPDGDTGVLLADVESCLSYRGLGSLEGDTPTFDDYKRAMVHKTREGWVTEGDLLFASEDELWLHYRYLFSIKNASTPSFRSLAACISSNSSKYDGLDKLWNVHRKLNLTYCFGPFEDEDVETAVKEAVAAATERWERAADVNFIRVDIPASQCVCGFDPDPELCPDRSYEVKIMVRQGREEECQDQDGDGTPDCFLGFADYPDVPDFDPFNTDRFSNLVRIWSGALTSEQGVQAVVIHELGHILGLAHEFSRYSHSDPSCIMNAEPSWRTVTEPDTQSVMGYDYCFNTFGKGAVPSMLDRQGLSYLYNLPRYTRTRVNDRLSDDIIWHRPGQEDYQVWQSAPNGSGPVIFTKETFCYDGNCTDSNVIVTPDPVKPLPIFAGPDRAGAFLYGLEDVEDSLRDHAGIPSIVAATRDGTFDVPLVGRFMGGDSFEEIWWVRPGAQTDPLWHFGLGSFVETPNFNGGVAASGYYRPLTGLWAPHLGAGLPGSQVLWYREDSATGRLVFLNVDLMTTTEISFGLCPGFNDPALFPREMVPLLGNFDSDTRMEMFAASVDGQASVLYVSPEELAGVAKPSAVECLMATDPVAWTAVGFKPFVGDFNGDNKDDIFWYKPGGGVDDDALFLSKDNATFQVMAMSQVDDFSPFVGDFNGDGCDDIFWYAPHRTFRHEPMEDPTVSVGIQITQGTSPLWRSVCNTTGQTDPELFLGFVEDTEQEVPIDSYPVGYNPRVGRWAR